MSATASTPDPASTTSIWSAPRTGLERKRAIISALGWGLCAVAVIVVIGALLSIVGLVAVLGAPALNLTLFTHITSDASPGLLNAIVGTFVIAIGTLLIAVPVGVAAGIYLSEYGTSNLANAIRFLAEVLTGTPSIVLGYFSYIVFVVSLGWHFSALAGAITVAIIVVPYLARITELALRQVPIGLREASFALGAKEPTVIFSIVLPGALSGVVTGVLLALAISVGETAPLIYTAGWTDQLWNGRLVNQPVGYLTYVIWSFLNEPTSQAHALAYAAALLVMLVVLAINIGVRLTVRRRKFA